MDKGTKRAIKQLEGPDGRSFAHRLENLIEINNITANALARNTGIPQSAISNYLKPCKDIDCENGRLPDCATIRVLANYFSVSADYLLGITRDPNIKKSAVDELNLSPSIVSVFLELKSLDRTPLENRSPHDQHIADVNLLLDAIKIYTQEFL